MHTIEANLKRYLDTECLLNHFFAVFDYCAALCIKPAMEGGGTGTVTVCCRKKYYNLHDLAHPAFDLLQQERHRLYGKPGERGRAASDSPCEYHNPGRGCLLTTHKSPTCLSFLCPEAIEVLRNEFGIFTYDYLGVYYALEWILTGDLSDRDYYAFRGSILDMTKRFKELMAASAPGRQFEGSNDFADGGNAVIEAVAFEICDNVRRREGID